MSAWLGSAAEKRSFDFFQTCASGKLGGYLKAPFWSREVLQAAIVYPPIRHLVVALGAAYERFECSDPNRLSGDDDDKMRFALQRCNLSIRDITNLAASSGQSPEAMCCILTASILFANFASLQADFLQAIQHVRSGMRVLRNLESLGDSCEFPVPIPRLRSLLITLYAQVRTMINDEARTDWDGRDPLVSDIEPVHSFLDSFDAQNYVERLFANTQAFFQRTELHPPVTLEQTNATIVERHKLFDALKSSSDALDALVARGSDEGDEKAIAISRLYNTWLLVRLNVSAFGEDQREAMFDRAEHHMSQMLGYCQLILANDDCSQDKTAPKPIYSSGLGVILPLRMIAARCRNTALRQEALDLLIRARRREWLWDSTLSGKVLETTIEIERGAASGADAEADRQGIQTVPDDGRVRETKLHFVSERSAWVDFITVGQWRNQQNGFRRFLQW
ncbi:MAG: hypothetical protein M1820_003603 [Bogoriella megaspora]|nr:MAG: hypothetical protein M1820_003603 [Bogoriella megaspora]